MEVQSIPKIQKPSTLNLNISTNLDLKQCHKNSALIKSIKPEFK
jgi:hypothetical protein